VLRTAVDGVGEQEHTFERIERERVVARRAAVGVEHHQAHRVIDRAEVGLVVDEQMMQAGCEFGPSHQGPQLWWQVAVGPAEAPAPGIGVSVVVLRRARAVEGQAAGPAIRLGSARSGDAAATVGAQQQPVVGAEVASDGVVATFLEALGDDARGAAVGLQVTAMHDKIIHLFGKRGNGRMAPVTRMGPAHPQTPVEPSMPLTEAQIADFHDRGYLVVRGLLDRERIIAIQEEIDALHDRMAEATPEGVGVTWEERAEGRPPRIRQLMNSEMVSPGIMDFTRSPELIAILCQLMSGEDIYLFHSKLMMKAAHDGTFTPWHQDWGYWQNACREPLHLNCMLALDPATEANGAIRFVPGSHKQGPIAHERDDEASGFQIGLPGDLDAYDADLVEMEPGDAVFFGPLVVHGSAPNTSAQDRRANTCAFDLVGNPIHRAPHPDRLRHGSLADAAARAAYHEVT